MFYPGMTRGRATLSVLIGIICIAVGGTPLLKLNISTTMPQLFSPFIVKIMLLIGGLLLLYDSFQIKNPLTGMIKGTSIIGGILLFIIGAVPLLIDTGILNKQLPFIATLSIPVTVLEGLLVFFGFYLLYDAYMLSRRFF